MRIKFDEKDHTYFVNGDIANISVTSLLAKHGLAPTYANVSEEVRNAKMQRGKDIHSDLENCVNTGDYEPLTKQGQQWCEWLDKNIDSGVAEQVCAIDYNSLLIAGTCDFIGFEKDGTPCIIDHKNTNSISKESVTWQECLYDYFLRKLNGENLNGKPFYWKGAVHFYCFQYNDEGELKIHNLEKISDEEIEKLLLCEYKGEIYQRPALVIDEELRAKVELAEMTLTALKEQEKAVAKQCEEYRAILLEKMKEQHIVSWETDKVKITYVAPQERITVDSTKLKKKYPQIYTECTKLTKVKDSLRITIRENGEDGENIEF